jgi:tRNA G18 (ribose-2'-O)-methylase SpoU
MGNEANGISSDVIAKCHYNIRIDMEPGVDSLSVPIATGILLHGIHERENYISERQLGEDN